MNRKTVQKVDLPRDQQLIADKVQAREETPLSCPVCEFSEQWKEQVSQNRWKLIPMFGCLQEESPNVGHWMTPQGECLFGTISPEKVLLMQELQRQQGGQKIIKPTVGQVKMIRGRNN